MFLRKLAACLSLVGLFVHPAYASQPNIFSNASYNDEDRQCADVGRFTAEAVVKATRNVNQVDLKSSFITEWSKRSIAPVNGAFIDSSVDKALYTSMAVRAESEVQRMGVNGIPPSVQSMQIHCKSTFESTLKNLNDNRSDEVEQARASLKNPTSPELILGERDYKNIVTICELTGKNTYTGVTNAMRGSKTPYDAKQIYYGKPRNNEFVYGKNPPNSPMFKYLPASQRYKGVLERVNRKYEDQLFEANADKTLADSFTKDCVKTSTDFWINNL